MVLGAIALVWAILICRAEFPPIPGEIDQIDSDERGHVRDLLNYPHFLFAVVAQFMYVGTQVSTWSYFIQYVQEYGHQPEKAAGYFLTGTLAAFGAGRFTSALLMRSLDPRKLMAAYSLINVCLLLVGILNHGWAGVWAVFLTSFFMSLMFPTIFATWAARPRSQYQDRGVFDRYGVDWWSDHDAIDRLDLADDAERCARLRCSAHRLFGRLVLRFFRRSAEAEAWWLDSPGCCVKSFINGFSERVITESVCYRQLAEGIFEQLQLRSSKGGQMAIVAGVDFGTLNVRVSLIDSDVGRLGSAAAEYPLYRKHDDPSFATQSHADQMRALVKAMREALRQTRISGDKVAAPALDTTGSSVVMVDNKLQPLDDYYLWCDHRAYQEAREITEIAHTMRIEAIQWCGGVYSHEWGWAKLLHWLRHTTDEKRAKFATALEHCDMVAATLTGVSSPAALKRSICAMGHKWMWNSKWDGFPPEEFFAAVDPMLRGVRAKMQGQFLASDRIYGKLTGGVGRTNAAKGRNCHPCGRIGRALGCDWCRVQAW